MHSILMEVWMKDFRKYGSGAVPPDFQILRGIIGHLLQTFPCDLPGITGGRLYLLARKLSSRKAGGTDGWRAVELALLPKKLWDWIA